MTESFVNPSSEDIRALLQRIRTIAVVGLSPKPGRASYGVARALQGFGYRSIPINPAVTEVLGERAYPNLTAVADPIDLVDVFRDPQHVAELVDECIALKLPALWLQDGVVDPVAAQRARAAGLMVVMDRCLYRDRAALMA